jgi:hypothetical protein
MFNITIVILYKFRLSFKYNDLYGIFEMKTSIDINTNKANAFIK